MTSGFKCLFCGQESSRRIRVQIFGHEGVIDVCEQHQEIVAGRGFRLEDVIGEQN
jgi:transcription elongation factor Elf1